LSMLINIVVFAFQYAWPVYMFKIQYQEKASQIYGKVFTLYVAIIGFLVFILSMFAREIILIMTNASYLDAKNIFIIISFAFLFWGMFYSGTPGLHIKNKTYLLSITIFLTALINIGLNLCFIPRFGIIGAAYSTLIAYFFMGIISVVLSNIYYPVKFEYRKLIVIAISLFGFYIFVSIIQVNYVFNILIKIIAAPVILILWEKFNVIVAFSEIKKILIDRIEKRK